MDKTERYILLVSSGSFDDIISFKKRTMADESLSLHHKIYRLGVIELAIKRKTKYEEI